MHRSQVREYAGCLAIWVFRPAFFQRAPGSLHPSLSKLCGISLRKNDRVVPAIYGESQNSHPDSPRSSGTLTTLD